jgi:uncharacterized repeat protein (TIGR01451 family)
VNCKKLRKLVTSGLHFIQADRRTDYKGWAGSCLGAGLIVLLAFPARGADFYTSATMDLSCAGTRLGSDLGCTAGEFTVGATFSAAPGTPPFCAAGGSFEFEVELRLSDSNADRYDIGFFTGQTGNDPAENNAANLCSVATFPPGGSPWQDLDADSCGDYLSRGDTVNNINKIKVLCQGDSTGALAVPYVLTYWQNNGDTCSGPTDVMPGNQAKCNKGTSTVSGAVKVYSGAYVDLTKQTLPDGDGQPFTFTATGTDVSAKVIAQVGSTFYPADIASATNSTSVTLSDGQTARFFINTTSSDQTLTITEAAATHWESTASISCAQVTGAPTLNVDNATRTITASGLNEANNAGACTVTNTKRSKITLVKNVAGRINAGDQFQVEATGGSTLTDDSGTPITAPVTVTTAGAATTAQTIFWSQPDQALTFTDSATGGSLTDYTTTYVCTNDLTGSPTTMPSGSATSFNLTPGPGDDITCTYTNAAKPTLTKAFATGTIGVEMPSTLTFTLTNPAGAPARTGLSFTDTLPANLVVAPAPNSAGTCTGTPIITAAAGSSSITVGGIDLAAGASSCTVSVDVTGSVAGSYLNGPARITAISEQLRNGVNDQTLNVRQVQVSKSYSAAEIFASGSSLLTFTLTNGTGNPAQGNLTFTDTLASGSDLTITGVTGLTGAGCSATTPTYIATGNPSVTLTGAGMSAGTAACTFTVSVTGNTEGSYANTAANISGATNPIDVSGLSSTLIVAHLGISKAFAPDAIDVYEPSSMTFTLTNTSSINLTDLNFTDTLNGFYVRSTSIGGTCAGVSNNPALAVGSTALDLTVPSLAAGTSCTIILSVTASLAGTYDNTTSVLTATGTGGTSGDASNTAILTVKFIPLEIFKAANGSSVKPGGTITYTIGYKNPNASTFLTNVVITDPLPAYTTFLSASCGPLPATITSCTVSAPAVGATGPVTWTLGGALDAGSSGNVYLSVQLN